MNRPSFFIIGFPKCGTTSLAGYLAEHPDVLISHHKEPHYFAFDFTYPVIRRVVSEGDYLRQFDDPRNDYLAVGEASTGYIFSDEAVDRILEFADDPKFILAVRNPVEMAVSAHAQMLQSGHEDMEDFRAAWRLSPARADGKCLPKHRTETWHVCYQDFGRIGTRLEWLLGKVGRDRLKVVVFDDLVNDPRSVYRDVLDFLGIPDDGRTSFDRRNRRRYHRHKLVANFVNRPPRCLVAVSQYVKRALGLKRIGIIDRMRNWNLREERRYIDKDLTHEMEEHYRAEVRKLESLLGRRLGWIPEDHDPS